MTITATELKNNLGKYLILAATEDIFITKNGYSDLVVMSSELYDEFAGVNRIDQAIYESELETANGFEPVDAEEVFSELEKKYFG